MTDRHSGYVVTLAEDVREDDAEYIINAIRMVKGVALVEPVTAVPIRDSVARGRRDQAWRDALFGLLENGPPPGGGG